MTHEIIDDLANMIMHSWYFGEQEDAVSIYSSLAYNPFLTREVTTKIIRDLEDPWVMLLALDQKAEELAGKPHPGWDKVNNLFFDASNRAVRQGYELVRKKVPAYENTQGNVSLMINMQSMLDLSSMGSLETEVDNLALAYK